MNQMTEELRRIKVIPGSELDRLLSVAAQAPVLLERDGERYRLYREADTKWGPVVYNPQVVREALWRAAGTWADLDADSLIAELYRVRGEGSRPADRP